LIRRLGLVYRKDKALSKAGLGFIQVVTERARKSPVSVESRESERVAALADLD
jgi:hypothetical protein